MPDNLLTLADFAPHLGESFEIAVEGREPYRLEMTEATGTGGDSDAREPFSVVFSGADDIVLPQRTYRLEHEKLGALEIFLVPLGPDKSVEGRMLYEAAFS